MNAGLAKPIRAIWFIPGRDIDLAQIQQPTGLLSATIGRETGNFVSNLIAPHNRIA